MTSEAAPARGYQVAPQDLTTQISALAGIADQTSSLVPSANRLADRLPMLGTAPPAIHLAVRLREAAGRSGLAGEIQSAGTELTDFHRALDATLAEYVANDAGAAQALRSTGGAEA
ncbi:hypothetical protein GCM10011581_24900 [Saccharopolyspora subtropica]|uniref:Uncharacterized protein n=1 Tax=Saccharopolyspora thermophila TaxID=89367 RepID=A0A917JU94_9PSEU|nr:hypothetical protein [Saccharopolyspora subtropica]GGI86816.1 hypothetical protein GCM10011581_24900 [Saccharopolyspora subtropica]